jgi:uncharacterized protein (TIGR03084 family)
VVAEYERLDDLLVGLAGDDWRRPTRAPGWAITDQVEHLLISEKAASLALDDRSSEVFGPHFRERTREDRSPERLLAGWRSARSGTVERFAARSDRDKVVWGAGPMSIWSFAQSRLMETWAHGLEIAGAADRPFEDTDRLHHVAGLAYRALPYAFAVAGVDRPVGDLAVDLTAPSGERWWFGPEGTGEIIRGPAGDWCRVATRRMAAEQSALVATGPLSAAAISVARAYLAD